MTTDCDTRRARIEVEILPPYSERFAAAWSGRDDEEPEWAKTISLGGSGEALGLLDITSSRLWSRGSARGSCRATEPRYRLFLEAPSPELSRPEDSASLNTTAGPCLSADGDCTACPSGCEPPGTTHREDRQPQSWSALAVARPRSMALSADGRTDSDSSWACRTLAVAIEDMPKTPMLANSNRTPGRCRSRAPPISVPMQGWGGGDEQETCGDPPGARSSEKHRLPSFSQQRVRTSGASELADGHTQTTCPGPPTAISTGNEFGFGDAPR